MEAWLKLRELRGVLTLRPPQLWMREECRNGLIIVALKFWHHHSSTNMFELCFKYVSTACLLLLVLMPPCNRRVSRRGASQCFFVCLLFSLSLHLIWPRSSVSLFLRCVARSRLRLCAHLRRFCRRCAAQCLRWLVALASLVPPQRRRTSESTPSQPKDSDSSWLLQLRSPLSLLPRVVVHSATCGSSRAGSICLSLQCLHSRSTRIEESGLAATMARRDDSCDQNQLSARVRTRKGDSLTHSRGQTATGRSASRRSNACSDRRHRSFTHARSDLCGYTDFFQLAHSHTHIARPKQPVDRPHFAQLALLFLALRLAPLTAAVVAMSDRKNVNKWYPPDFDPSKGSLNTQLGQHPLRKRAAKLDEGILVIRFELPFNCWCEGCKAHIGKGVRYNAEKKQAGNYFSTKIWEFRMTCHLCMVRTTHEEQGGRQQRGGDSNRSGLTLPYSSPCFVVMLSRAAQIPDSHGSEDISVSDGVWFARKR